MACGVGMWRRRAPDCPTLCRAMRKQAERVLNDFYDKLDDDLFWFKIKRRKKNFYPLLYI